MSKENVTEEKVEVGDTGISFDDLDAVETLPEKEIAEEEVKEEKKDELKANDEDLAKDEEKVEKKKEEKKEEEENEEVKQEAPKRGIKATIGDQEMTLDPKAIVKVKVNGEFIDMPLKEIINKASGEIAVEKKFNEVDKLNKEAEGKIKQFETQIHNVSEHLKKVVSGLNSDNPLEGLKYLVDLSKGNFYDIHNRLFNSFYEEFEKVYEMDDVEKRAFFLEKENNFLRESKKSEVNHQQKTQAEEERFTAMDKQREAAGVAEEEFISALEDLKEVGEKTDFNTVLNYAQGAKLFNKAEGLVKNVNDEYASDNEFVLQVARMVGDGSFTDAEIVDIIKEAVGNNDEKIKEINKKVIPDDSFDEKIVKKDKPDLFDDF